MDPVFRVVQERIRGDFRGAFGAQRGFGIAVGGRGDCKIRPVWTLNYSQSTPKGAEKASCGEMVVQKGVFWRARFFSTPSKLSRAKVKHLKR